MIRELPPPYPKEYSTRDYPRLLAWLTEFRQTEAGRVYARQERVYAAVVAEDGTFRIENVDAGSYKLALTVPNISIGEHGSVWDRVFGKANREVVMPEGSRGRSVEPFDLGRIELTPAIPRKLQVGDAAATFTIKAARWETPWPVRIPGKICAADLLGELVRPECRRVAAPQEGLSKPSVRIRDSS